MSRSTLTPLTHVSAIATLAFVAQATRFPASWFEVPLLERAPEQPLPFLSVIVPARNEERSIERCVRSLTGQRYVEMEVIVVDDRSTDRTPEILAALAAHEARVRVVTGDALPAGWVGKPWALHQGAAVARGAWLLFTDADAVHAPSGVASALAFALAARTDALSVATRQELGTFWERATLPFILGIVLYVSGTLAELNDPLQPKRALANGQYILVERATYDALGGHAALRGELAEDLQFARRLKADGRFRLVLGGGTRLATVRMYHSLPEIWNGFTKNVYVGADGNVPALAAGVAAMFVLSAAPLLAAVSLVRRKPFAALEALAALTALVTTTRRGMRMVGMHTGTAACAPFGFAFLGAVMLNSTFRVLSGRGVEWRGRRYSGRPTGAADLSEGL